MSTFKEKAVTELLTVLPADQKGATAFLAGAARAAGALHMRGKRCNLVLSLPSYEACLAVVDLLKLLYPSEFEVTAEHVKSGVRKGSTDFSVSVPTGFTRQALDDLDMFDDEGEVTLPEYVLTDRGSAEAFLKGLFLGCGSVYVPSTAEGEKRDGYHVPSTAEGEKRDGYHFEFALDSPELAGGVAAVLRSFGISPKLSERGSSTLVYLKDKDEILRMLASLGLAECVLELKAVIDERETANSINRVTICEAANLDKTYAAASSQLMAIGLIEERDGLDSLTPSLAETARARLAHPQASLGELADILGVSRSCLNHRLRRLKEISDTGE